MNDFFKRILIIMGIAMAILLVLLAPLIMIGFWA